MPDGLTAAAEVMGLTRFHRLLKRYGIHITVHQKLTRRIVGRDGRNQPMLIEFGREIRALFDLLDADSRGEFFRHWPRVLGL